MFLEELPRSPHSFLVLTLAVEPNGARLPDRTHLNCRQVRTGSRWAVSARAFPTLSPAFAAEEAQTGRIRQRPTVPTAPPWRGKILV
jgi:hypothetical protein